MPHRELLLAIRTALLGERHPDHGASWGAASRYACITDQVWRAKSHSALERERPVKTHANDAPVISSQCALRCSPLQQTVLSCSAICPSTSLHPGSTGPYACKLLPNNELPPTPPWVLPLLEDRFRWKKLSKKLLSAAAAAFMESIIMAARILAVRGALGHFEYLTKFRSIGSPHVNHRRWEWRRFQQLPTKQILLSGVAQYAFMPRGLDFSSRLTRARLAPTAVSIDNDHHHNLLL